MQNYIAAEKKDTRRKRRERYLIVFLLMVIPSLTYLGTRVFDLGLDHQCDIAPPAPFSHRQKPG